MLFLMASRQHRFSSVHAQDHQNELTQIGPNPGDCGIKKPRGCSQRLIFAKVRCVLRQQCMRKQGWTDQSSTTSQNGLQELRGQRGEPCFIGLLLLATGSKQCTIQPARTEGPAGVRDKPKLYHTNNLQTSTPGHLSPPQPRDGLPGTRQSYKSAAQARTTTSCVWLKSTGPGAAVTAVQLSMGKHGNNLGARAACRNCQCVLCMPEAPAQSRV